MKEETARKSHTIGIGDDPESALSEYGLEQNNVYGVVPRWTRSKPVLIVNAVIGILMAWGMFIYFVPALFSNVSIAKPLIDWIEQWPKLFAAISICFVPLGALYGTFFFTAVAISEVWLKRRFMRTR